MGACENVVGVGGEQEKEGKYEFGLKCMLPPSNLLIWG